MTNVELQDAINKTVFAITLVGAFGPGSPELQSHLKELLAEQAGRARACVFTNELDDVEQRR